MASSLLALLSQQSPVKTRRGLILTGLQNDFLSPEGKLPVNVPPHFLDRLAALVKEFREHGDIVWVRSHFKENRAVNVDDDSGDAVIVGSSPTAESPSSKRSIIPVRTRASTSDENDHEHPPSPPKKARLSSESRDASTEPGNHVNTESRQPNPEPDEELFLTRTTNREPCCIPGSFGADYPAEIAAMLDTRRDLQLIKTYYSAFASTSLLITLRAKLVTELYICGCTTNLSLFATAMDAARHGISITLVDDCLGYRRKDRHDKAIKQLSEIMGARLMTSKEVIDSLLDPASEPEDDDSESADAEVAMGEDASGIAVDDALAVDSDEEEEDEGLLSTSVRLTRTGGRPLPYRAAFALSSDLRGVAASEPDYRTPTEPAKSPHTREPNAGRSDGAGGNIVASPKQHRTSGGRHENHFDGWVGRATAHGRSIASANESTKTVTQRPSPGWKVINQEWADKNRALQHPQFECKHTGLSAISAIVGLDQKTVDEYEGMMLEAKQKHGGSPAVPHESKPLFGHETEELSGGSRIYYDLLPAELASSIFEKLNQEINWQTMFHQTGEVPRLVCCQGTIGADGSMPVYRHPADQTLPIDAWSPTVDQVRKAAEEVVGHPLNHALIQLYRNGNDYISEHSDKTLDIVKDSKIVNVSFGAQRKMRLRTKRKPAASVINSTTTSLSRATYRVPMPHNSMITMTLPTNAEYLHGINADKRPAVELIEAETAFAGQRISLTFRHIGTFLDKTSEHIWGQGATAKAKEDAKAVINADADQSENLVRAFGRENSASSIEWDEMYGEGFDVLHLK